VRDAQLFKCSSDFSKEEEHQLANKRNQLDSPNTGVFSQLKVLPWVLGTRRELAQRESIVIAQECVVYSEVSKYPLKPRENWHHFVRHLLLLVRICR
jgi:hypothetical protein